MPKIAYKQINFRDKSLELIDKVNEIVEEYDVQNYELTLRQLYYQLVILYQTINAVTTISARL